MCIVLKPPAYFMCIKYLLHLFVQHHTDILKNICFKKQYSDKVAENGKRSNHHCCLHVLRI